MRKGNGVDQLLASGSFLVALGIGRKLRQPLRPRFRFLVFNGLVYTFQFGVFLAMSAVMIFAIATMFGATC